MLVGPFGHQYFLQQAHLFQLPCPAQHGRTPGDPQADPEGRLRGAVPRDIPYDRVDRAVHGLDDVVEVTAQQAVGAPRLVPGDGLEVVAAQQRDGEEATFQPGVLLGHLLVRAEGSRGLFDLLALERVAEGPAQRLRVEPSLDEIVLRTGRHGGEARLALGQAGEDHDGGVRGAADDTGDGVDSLRVRQVQVEQHTDRSGAGGQEPLGLGQRLAPGERGVQVAVGEHLLHEERVARVVLDEQQDRVAGPQGVAYDRCGLL